MLLVSLPCAACVTAYAVTHIAVRGILAAVDMPKEGYVVAYCVPVIAATVAFAWTTTTGYNVLFSNFRNTAWRPERRLEPAYTTYRMEIRSMDNPKQIKYHYLPNGVTFADIQAIGAAYKNGIPMSNKAMVEVHKVVSRTKFEAIRDWFATLGWVSWDGSKRGVEFTRAGSHALRWMAEQPTPPRSVLE